MGKDKLRKFKEIGGLYNVVEPKTEEVRHGFELKGNWALVQRSLSQENKGRLKLSLIIFELNVVLRLVLLDPTKLQG